MLTLALLFCHAQFQMFINFSKISSFSPKWQEFLSLHQGWEISPISADFCLHSPPSQLGDYRFSPCFPPVGGPIYIIQCIIHRLVNNTTVDKSVCNEGGLVYSCNEGPALYYGAVYSCNERRICQVPGDTRSHSITHLSFSLSLSLSFSCFICILCEIVWYKTYIFYWHSQYWLV